MDGCFVTGTDTGIGKTIVAAAIIRGLNAGGIAAVGMKPIASGSALTEEGLRNDDALALAAASTSCARYADINPYCFAPAISPHLAARAAGVPIDLEVIRSAYARLRTMSDFVVVEGAGGWLAPIDDAGRTMADLAATLAVPVVLVVGLRLGCLNHAALTLASIRACRAPLAGWIANALDPGFEFMRENLQTLTAMFGAAPLATLPHAPPPELALKQAAHMLAAGSHGGRSSNL